MPGWLGAAADDGAVLLAVCGGYQLLGHSYQMGDDELPGLGLAELTLRDDEGRPARLSGTRNYWMDYVARLRPGVSLEQANAAAAVLAAQLVTPGAEGQPSGRASRVWFIPRERMTR